MEFLNQFDIIKREEKSMKTIKKKGFTLVELIAVIAILAILAAIIVPKIVGYTDKAKLSREQANARVITNSIQVYNTECATGKTLELTATTTLTNISTGTVCDKTVSSYNDMKDAIDTAIAAGGKIDGSTQVLGLSNIIKATVLPSGQIITDANTATGA